MYRPPSWQPSWISEGTNDLGAWFPIFLESAYPKTPIYKFLCFLPEVNMLACICHISAPLYCLHDLYTFPLISGGKKVYKSTLTLLDTLIRVDRTIICTCVPSTPYRCHPVSYLSPVASTY